MRRRSKRKIHQEVNVALGKPNSVWGNICSFRFIFLIICIGGLLLVSLS